MCLQLYLQYIEYTLQYTCGSAHQVYTVLCVVYCVKWLGFYFARQDVFPAFTVLPYTSRYGLFSTYQLNAHFLYSITIYMLHYNPQHVSSSTFLIFRTTNCIITAFGIVTLCKQPSSVPVESPLSMSKVLLETC